MHGLLSIRVDLVNSCDAYLAAGQVQGSVLVLIQQCQVSLGPVKEDGWTTPRHKDIYFLQLQMS